MANPWFRFKQFTIFHDKSTMKVGADGVTLGAWARLGNTKKILDIGCGSGLLALMAAQRSSANIIAIDIDADSAQQTRENAANSPWRDRVETMHTSLQDFAKQTSLRFDHIISNPPYFTDSLKNPSEKRSLARHTDTLPHIDLVVSAKKLLTERGKLSLILPVNEGKQFLETAKQEGFFLYTLLYAIPQSQATRQTTTIRVKP